MKQKDLLIIGLVIVLTTVASYIIANKLITTPADRQQQVQVVPTITDQFKQPDTQYFNAQALDPTQLIHISQNTVPVQFSTTNNQ